MNNEEIKCECGNSMNIKEFNSHFIFCEQLINKYKDFDFKLSQLLKLNLNSNNILIIKFIFKKYIKLLDSKLKNLSEINNNSTPNKESLNIYKNGQIEKISLKLTIVFIPLVFLMEVDLNEKLSEIIIKFKNSLCPTKYKKSLLIPTYNGEKIDPNQTLSKYCIKNGDIIQLLEKDINSKIKNDDFSQESEFSKEEIIQFKKWQKEFESMKNINIKLITKYEENIDKMIPKNIDILKLDYINFICLMEKNPGIIIKEHNHKLLYCLTNFNWKCNICNKDYNKNNAKYYCSICDFNMCDKCNSKGNYTKKKSFPEYVIYPKNLVSLQFFITNCHEHRLIYGRSSRYTLNYNTWICDICKNKFENQDWSFFCTECDYDLCYNCFIKL